MPLTERKKEDLVIQEKLFDPGKSNLRKYQDLVIGSRSIGTLVKYELLQLLASWVPGAFFPAQPRSVGAGD